MRSPQGQDIPDQTGVSTLRSKGPSFLPLHHWNKVPWADAQAGVTWMGQVTGQALPGGDIQVAVSWFALSIRPWPNQLGYSEKGQPPTGKIQAWFCFLVLINTDRVHSFSKPSVLTSPFTHVKCLLCTKKAWQMVPALYTLNSSREGSINVHKR